MIKVLFVCTGNICRSPTAEGVFRHLAAAEGLDGAFFIASAGTQSGHVGQKPDARAILVAKRHGISLEGQRARNVRDEDFAEFDYIFAMDKGHLRELNRRAPGSCAAKVGMFLEKGDVPDPWYGDEGDFIRVFDMVHSRAAALLNEMKKEHNL